MATNATTKQPAVRQTLAPRGFGDVGDLLSLLDARWPFHALRSTIAREPIPAVDMFERDGNLVIKAELAGIAPDKIEVSVSGNELRISGEREEEKEVKSEHYYHAERAFGHMYRSVTLPEGYDAGQVNAAAKDGVIEITVPKSAAAATKRIQVMRA
jgi:HSP20 family protein